MGTNKDKLEHAIKTAIAAGEILMSKFGKHSVVTKEDGSPVTDADILSNQLILSELSKWGFPILSEESPPLRLPYLENLWVVDPLDGTKEFIEGDKDFSVMIALLQNGTPTISVIYAPALGILYFGERNSGAYMRKDNGERRLKVSDISDTKKARFLQSSRHFTQDMQDVADKLSVSARIPRGSIGIKAGLIAEGEGEFYYTLAPLGEWDACASHLIVTEAGGRVTDCNDKPLVYGNEKNRIKNGIVISNGHCHSQVIEAIREVFIKP